MIDLSDVMYYQVLYLRNNFYPLTKLIKNHLQYVNISIHYNYKGQY